MRDVLLPLQLTSTILYLYRPLEDIFIEFSRFSVSGQRVVEEVYTIMEMNRSLHVTVGSFY